MQINLSKFVGWLTLVISIALFGCFGYFFYLVVIDGNDVGIATSIESVNASAFGPKVQTAVTALTGSGKISFKQKDLQFTETNLFKSFVDDPEDVPFSDSRGRPNPFVPYVAP